MGGRFSASIHSGVRTSGAASLKLHQTIAGAANGGVGNGLSPRAALGLGLKVDMAALPQSLVDQIKAGQVNLGDPATTLALLRLKAVVGVTGFFNSQDVLSSVGIQCAICHSTVDDAFASGIGNRRDGWPNRDLDIGRIIAFSADLGPLARALEEDVPTVTAVLTSWGPGKFDAELALDGKAFRPDGRSAATLIPPAFGLAGVNLHTWTGWGSVTHWNAFVSNLEMHGKGRFFDPRLINFPLAFRRGYHDVKVDPKDDLITSKLPALHFYQLGLRSPKPAAGTFDSAAASRGQALFNGKAQCFNCHVPPIFTEPGWNMHTPNEVCIDSFQ